nr:protein kinase-like domain-containing protein [Tanacetum cinerariifolium]
MTLPFCHPLLPTSSTDVQQERLEKEAEIRRVRDCICSNLKSYVLLEVANSTNLLMSGMIWFMFYCFSYASPATGINRADGPKISSSVFNGLNILARKIGEGSRDQETSLSFADSNDAGVSDSIGEFTYGLGALSLRMASVLGVKKVNIVVAVSSETKALKLYMYFSYRSVLPLPLYQCEPFPAPLPSSPCLSSLQGLNSSEWSVRPITRGHIIKFCPMDDKNKDKATEMNTSESAKGTKELLKPTKPSVDLKYPECIYFQTKGILKGTHQGQWDDFWSTLCSRTLNIISIDLLEKQAFEILYDNDRCSLEYMFKEQKGQNLDENKLRQMQNKYLEDYFESLDREDTSVEEDWIMIKGNIYSTRVHTFNEYVAFLNLIKQDEIVSQEWDLFRKRFDKVNKDKATEMNTSESAKGTKELLKPTKASVDLKENFIVDKLDDQKQFQFTYGMGEVMIKIDGQGYLIPGVHYAPEVTLNIISIDLLEKQAFEILYDDDRCSLEYMFKEQKGQNLDENKLRQMQNKYLKDYFESLDREDTSMEEDWIRIKGYIYSTRVHTFNEYVAFLNLIKQDEIVSQEWDLFRKSKGTTRFIEEDRDRDCLTSHQWDSGETSAPSASKITHDPYKVLTTWNDSFHFCDWVGITCGKRHKRVTALRVFSNGLEGTLSPHVGNLSFLRGIPPFLGNITSMEGFSAHSNPFGGRIPDTLGLWKSLTAFGAGDCNLYGSIPHSMFNLSLLVQVSLAENNLTGRLPLEIGNQLPNLERLQLRNSELTGVLPPSLSNCSKLGLLDMGYNSFSGKLTIDFSKLRDINEIYLSNNNFHQRGEADDMRFIDSLRNCTRLVILSLSNCKLVGMLPISIESNKLEGHIPSSLGNCKELNGLTLGDNKLSGKMPKQLLQLPSLTNFLDLSYNNLSGSIPSEIKELKMLSYLDLSYNNLLGNITSSLGECISLTELYLHGNIFQGIIPSSFSSLRGLKVLDISQNNLSGKIPQFLDKWNSLEFLNLSFNDFEGEVPVVGVFANASAFSVLGNNRLCGGSVTLELPKCKEDGSKKKRFPFFILVNVIAPTLLIILCYVYLFCKKKRNHQPSQSSRNERFLKVSYNELLKATDGFSTENLIAEGGFGSFYKGILDSDDDKFVAIKVLHLENRGAHKSFLAECEAWRNIRHRNVLKIITSCSSVDFQGNDFEALVYEFMSKGSVHDWLHSSENTSKLNLLQRINILRDVATALDYLHNHCQTTIVHGDLKPSNILLDADMVSHVGDFGLARLLGADFNQNISTGVKGTIEYGIMSDMTSCGDVYSFGISLLEVITGKKPTDGIFNDCLSLHKFVYMALPDHALDVIDDDAIVLQCTETDAKKVEECLAATIKIGVSCSVDSPPQRMKIEIVVIELQRILDVLQNIEENHNLKAEKQALLTSLPTSES